MKYCQPRLKMILGLIFLGAVVLAWWHYRDRLTLDGLHAWVLMLGIWAPLGFIACYALATVLLFPALIFTLGGGFFFGAWMGFAYNMTGAMLGSVVAFLIARYFGCQWISEKIGGRLKTLKESVEQSGWRFVAVVRLVPILPFNLLNYGLGLTKIKLVEYIFATLVFISPACFVYTYIGSLGNTLQTGEYQDLATKGFLAVGGIILLWCIPWLVKQWKK